MKEGVALKQLADVLPPPAPGTGAWLLWLTIPVIIIAVVALFWFMRKHQSPRGNTSSREARRRLATLRHAWQSKTINDRDAAYRLATLLRLGFGLPQLTPQHCPDAIDEIAWRETLKELHGLRYRNANPPALSSRCFERAEQWLTAHGEVR